MLPKTVWCRPKFWHVSPGVSVEVQDLLCLKVRSVVCIIRSKMVWDVCLGVFESSGSGLLIDNTFPAVRVARV